jgi:hypothetical protein
VEGALLLLLLALQLGVGHDNVVHVLLVVRGRQSQRHRQLALVRQAAAGGRLVDDIVAGDLPEAIPLRLDAHHEEVDRNDGPPSHLEVLLHKADDHLRLFGNCQPELWVVEPAVVGVELCARLALRLLGLPLARPGVAGAGGVALPLTGCAVELPGGEDFGNVHLVEVGLPVVELHPGVARVAELIA